MISQLPPIATAAPVPSGLLSGDATSEASKLEEDYTVLPSSPDHETVPEHQVVIKAVNPGYSTAAGKNAGEFIELSNVSDEEVDLSHFAIVYTSKPTSTNPNGKSVILYEFPEGSLFIGDSILLRYKSSPEADTGQQDLVYSDSLAMTGSLALVILNDDFDASRPPDSIDGYGELLSSVCWLGGEDCLPVFSTTVKSRSYTTIVRNEDTGEYEHVQSYLPSFDPAFSGLFLPEELPPEDSDLNDSPSGTASSTSSSVSPVAVPLKDSPCYGLEFSELYTYYEDSPTKQFIEFYNSSKTSINLSKCSLRYKNKTYPLSDSNKTVRPGDLFIVTPPVSLTKNPTTNNLYELIDNYGNIIDSLELPHGQKKSASYALTGRNNDGSESWQITYNRTPGQPNIYQEFQTCPAGKIINEATGNCVNAPKLSSVLKDCGEGKYRNPETGRCKKIEEDDGPAPCQEGYERNPETGRCRKIKQNAGADFPVVPVTDVENTGSIAAICALAALILIGVLYTVFQFRKEIFHIFRRFLTKFKKERP